MVTRRTALATLGAAAAAARGSAQAQERRFGLSAARRTAPMLCAFSQNLAKIPYAELGPIAAAIGYEGIDLTVAIGGHVDPRVTNVDLVRAFEMMRGAGLEVPVISTNIVSATEATTYPVLYLTGHSQVPLFRTGYWPYPETGDPQRALARVRIEVAQIASVAQHCEMAALFPNRAGSFVGQTIAEAQTIVGGMDPRAVGYYFDPAEAGEDWETAFRTALPRIKVISMQDFRPEKSGGDQTMRRCPLGEGIIDWQKLFAMAAEAHFTGPISIHMEYKAANEPAAMAKDLEFARKQVEQAWPQSGPHS